MKLIYVHENGKEEVLIEVVTNHSMSVEEVLELTEFDMQEWSQGEDYDYNALKIKA